VLPGAVFVTLLAWLHAAGASWPLVAAAFAGTRPAVVALIALAAWRIGRKSLTSAAAVVLLVGAIALLTNGVAFPVVVLAAGVLGGLLLAPMVKTGSGAVQVSSRGPRRLGPMLLELAPTPSPPSSRSRTTGWGLAGSARHLVLVVGVAAVIWAACLWGVTGTHAAGGRGAAIARLFTTTTLLSLGGAYAVVPWALDESVARGAALVSGRASTPVVVLAAAAIGAVGSLW
jgi:chromate transporter